MQQGNNTLLHTPFPYFSRTSYVTLLLFGVIALGIVLFLLGSLLQLGAFFAPWLMNTGFTFLQDGAVLFCIFRLLVWIGRLLDLVQHHKLIQPIYWRWYQFQHILIYAVRKLLKLVFVLLFQ